MEPATTPRPVMDIQPQRPTPRPLPRADFAAPAAQPTPTPEFTSPQAAPEIPEDHQEVQPTPAEFPAKLPKAKPPIAAIIIAILVGFSLIGLTIFGYLKTQDKEEVATPNAATTQTITPEEIDTSINATGAALEALEAAGFNTDDLSDDSLGL